MAKRISSEKIKETRTFTEMIEQKFGENIVELPDEAEDIEAISTGSPSLDISIGIGGIPRGRFTEIYGAYQSAKTSLCLSIAKEAMKKGYKVLYVDVEQGLDYNYIEAIVGKFDPNVFVLAQPETAEQATDICEMAIDSGEFAVIVLDSVAALSPKKEQDDEAEDAHYALLARAMTKFFRRNAFKVRTNNVAFILVNQVRDKIGAYVKTYEVPGGNAIKHYTSLMIFLSASEQIKVGENIKGFYSKYTIKKNKVGIPFRSFMFPFMFGEGIDYERDLMELAELLNVVSKRGSYYVFEGVNIGQGIVNTISYLKEHQETLDKIKEGVYNIGTNKSSVPVVAPTEELAEEI